MKQDTEIEADYFGLAAAWDEELYGKLKQDRKIAYVVAGASMAIAALAVGAVLMLTPLKTVEPYVVMVDKTTGYAEATRKLVYDQANPITGQEAVVLGEINDYVIARHTFDPTDLEARYNRIRLSTNADEFVRYDRELRSETERLNAGARRRVTIKSIIPNISNKSATIRYSTETTNLNRSETQHWIATLTYDFMDLPMEMKYRYMNPLGFIVQSYRVDPENVQ